MDIRPFIFLYKSPENFNLSSNIDNKSMHKITELIKPVSLLIKNIPIAHSIFPASHQLELPKFTMVFRNGTLPALYTALSGSNSFSSSIRDRSIACNKQ